MPGKQWEVTAPKIKSPAFELAGLEVESWICLRGGKNLEFLLRNLEFDML